MNACIYVGTGKIISQTESPETILLDYGGPNVTKPVILGTYDQRLLEKFLKRIMMATGRTTISDVHLGDWGLQIGLVIAELQERHPDI
jgi:arginyl-tRNA synthetase